MKLLIVDDHALFREGLVSLISRQADMQVIGEAGTVSEAVSLMRQAKPDIILMDFTLPDGTGLDATRLILADHPQARVIFLTIHDDDERLFAALRLGAKGYLLKNVPVARLLAALRGVANGEPALSPDMVNRVLDEFSRTSADSQPADPLALLSVRELEVLRAMARGATNAQIAEQLFISENTVRNHVHNILDKLNLKNRRQAVAVAHQHGLR